ncbi:MAG TPA: hypothetical protein VJX67_25800 [Blastocatellia bacterium]|nr:hypothetical protein [Blastocatellia bacterium]
MKTRNILSDIISGAVLKKSSTVRKAGLAFTIILTISLGLCACGGASDTAKDAGGAQPPAGSESKPSKPSSTSPWGSFAVGSFVKMKTTVSTQVMGKAMDTSTETKMTLAELTADKALVDVEATVMGATNKSRMEVPLTGTATPAGGSQGTPGHEVKTGTETITVAGKSLDCKTTEVEVDTGGNKVNTKTWTSDQVPGFVVKSVSTSSGAAETKTTMEVVEFKAS